MTGLQPITLRGLTIKTPIALAPMVGLSHTALRTLVLSCGGAGLLYTEMLPIRRLPSLTPEHSPLLTRTPEEFPLFYQIVGSDPDLVQPALNRIHRCGGDGVDLNLGCPSLVQRRQSAGSALVEDRSLLVKMLRAIRGGTKLPLTVKIRLRAKKEGDSLADLCRLFENEGVDLITVHARFAKEKFCRKPKWNLVSEAKQAVHIPVFVNGGIFTVEDAANAISQSGADGLMIGRGAVMKPFLLNEIACFFSCENGQNKSFDMRKMYYRFVVTLIERFAPEKRFSRLKLFSNYYSMEIPFGHTLNAEVQGSSTFEEAVEKGYNFFSRFES